MRQTSAPRWLNALALFLFVVASLPIAYWNTALFQWINHWSAPGLEPVLGILSGLGDGLIVALLLTMLAMLRLRAGLTGLLAFLLSGLLAQILKRLFDMPRPPAVLEHVHLLGPALYSHSFPSGHATSCGVMLALAVSLWSWKDGRTMLTLALFLSAAIGRIYGGVHFPWDVWVGLWLGVVSMLACWHGARNWPWERWRCHPWTPRLLALIALVESAVLGLGYHVQPTTAQPLALPLAVLGLLALRAQRLRPPKG